MMDDDTNIHFEIDEYFNIMEAKYYTTGDVCVYHFPQSYSKFELGYTDDKKNIKKTVCTLEPNVGKTLDELCKEINSCVESNPIKFEANEDMIEVSLVRKDVLAAYYNFSYGESKLWEVLGIPPKEKFKFILTNESRQKRHRLLTTKPTTIWSKAKLNEYAAKESDAKKFFPDD